MKSLGRKGSMTLYRHVCYRNLFSHAKLSDTLRDDMPDVTYPIGLEGSKLSN